jgi:hypothetical protein
VAEPTDPSRSIWTFPADVIGGVASLKDFEVEAADGTAGKVAWASYAPGESYILVTLQHPLHRIHHVIPGGAVITVNAAERKLRVAFTRREIEDAPRHHDPSVPVDLSSPDFLAGLWPSWLHGRTQ